MHANALQIRRAPGKLISLIIVGSVDRSPLVLCSQRQAVEQFRRTAATVRSIGGWPWRVTDSETFLAGVSPLFNTHVPAVVRAVQLRIHVTLSPSTTSANWITGCTESRRASLSNAASDTRLTPGSRIALDHQLWQASQ